MMRVLALDGGLGWSFWDGMYGNLDWIGWVGKVMYHVDRRSILYCLSIKSHSRAVFVTFESS
jgi:hypothetical protein